MCHKNNMLKIQPIGMAMFKKFHYVTQKGAKKPRQNRDGGRSENLQYFRPTFSSVTLLFLGFDPHNVDVLSIWREYFFAWCQSLQDQFSVALMLRLLAKRKTDS